MIRVLLLAALILGSGPCLVAAPISGTFDAPNIGSTVGYDAGPFQSPLSGDALALFPGEFAFSYSDDVTSSEFVAPAMIPEVVRIVLMGSALIALAGLWRHRESRRLNRFV